jgi:hypothetical protein
VANEVTFSSLSSNGGRISAVLSALVAEQLYDPTDLRATMTRYQWSAWGSDTMDITQNAVPGAFAAASSETSGGASNSAYTTSKFSLQVARYLRIYQVTDLFGVSGGPIDVNTVVQNLVDGVALTMTDLVTTLYSSLANNVGDTTVNLTVANIYEAMFQLNNSNATPSSCVLHPVQMSDFINGLRAETGAMQYQPATAELLRIKGPGFQGTWNGISFYQSDSCPTANAGADRVGAMTADGCFAYTLAPVAALQGQIPADSILIDTGDLIVEAERDAANGMTSCIANLYPAVVEAEDLRGVAIITDA